MLRRARVIVGLLAASALALASVPSYALEWSHAPTVAVGAVADSNLSLSPYEERPANSARASAELDVAARSPGFNFWLNPEVVALRYADDAEADRNNVFANFGLGLARPRHDWSLGGTYARESTLTSEFEGSGFLGLDIEQTRRDAFTAFNRTLGPRGRLGFTASATRIEYGDQPSSSPFADHGYDSVQLSYLRQTATRSSWRFGVRRTFFDPEPGVLNRTLAAVDATWSRRFSPVLSGEFGFGAYTIDRGELGRQDPSASFNFALTRAWPQWTFRSAGGREVQSENVGVLTEVDSLTIDAQRRFSERLSLGVSWRGARETSVVQIFYYKRDYTQTGASLSWKIARRLDLNASVYDRAQVSSFTPRADGFATTVFVSYRGG